MSIMILAALIALCDDTPVNPTGTPIEKLRGPGGRPLTDQEKLNVRQMDERQRINNLKIEGMQAELNRLDLEREATDRYILMLQAESACATFEGLTHAGIGRLNSRMNYLFGATLPVPAFRIWQNTYPRVYDPYLPQWVKDNDLLDDYHKFKKLLQEGIRGINRATLRYPQLNVREPAFLSVKLTELPGSKK